MTIQATGVSAISIGDLLEQNLRIPQYQRPYSWQPATALQLLDDLRDAQASKAQIPYVLGAVILHARAGWLDVVDGQQRLLTLKMIFAILQSDHALALDKAADNNPVKLVWQALEQKLARLDGKGKDDLLDFIRTRCQLVRIVTDDVDEAFRVFDSQNYRGKPLAPHDLLKAYHLREMRGESTAMQAAVVQAWESVDDKQLNRLFSTFLYRIACWSRGKSAPGFSIHDIGMFKGISPKARSGFLLPSERYHLAAQAAMPLLTAWIPSTEHDARDVGRSRFQLDAPPIAGRPFFEMVSFMLQELAVLEKEAKEYAGAFDGSQSRYRYVYELFIAALLYFTNKCGTHEFRHARDTLFAWAYALRVAMTRVQFASADNRARGKDAASPFVLMRNTAPVQALRQLSVQLKPPHAEHEKALVAFITKTNTP